MTGTIETFYFQIVYMYEFKQWDAEINMQCKQF